MIELCLTFLLIASARADDFVDRARASLQAGRYSEAVSFYTQAIDANPGNHLVYYLRGYLYEVLGKLTHSIGDLSKCLEINPNFHKARFNRAQIYLKQGKFAEASEDFGIIVKAKETEFMTQSQAYIATISKTKKLLNDFEYFTRKNKLSQANETSSVIVAASPFNIIHRQKRVDLFEKMKNSKELENELKLLCSLLPNDLEILLRLSNILYERGEIDDSTGYLSRCLQRDPDNTNCKVLFKKLKGLKKLYNKIDENYNKPDYKLAAKFSHELYDSSDSAHYKFLANAYLCQTYHKLKEYNKSLGYCSTVIKSDPEHIDVLLVRADIYISREQYDDAKADYNAILAINSHHREAREGLQRIENILKNLNRPDYYKQLNVSRSATTQEIERSYRKLVKKWHPDHYREAEDIKIANKKLEELNSARQVLTDADMRKRFDDGFDPLDPQDQASQRSSGGHSSGDHGSFFNFFQGGNPFENQGGQHFKFSFG